MKCAAMSVWVFINLVCFGMCGYIYLIWSQYWMRIENQNDFNKPNLALIKSKSIVIEKLGTPVNYIPDGTSRYSTEPSELTYRSKKTRRSAVMRSKDRAPYLKPTDVKNTVIIKNGGKPRFPNKDLPLIELDSNKYQCEDAFDNACQELTAEFKNKLLKELHRVLMDESDVFKSGINSQNPYNVMYNTSESTAYKEKTKDEMLSELKEIQISTIQPQDIYFSPDTLANTLPRLPLLRNKSYNTCAVVASSGALRGSMLGSFIDSHDLVLRFNNAPTAGYSEDVGNKTNIRIINSQVVSKKKFDFLKSSQYKNISLLVWDPSAYDAPLEAWYFKPDFHFIPNYIGYMTQHPDADFHILNPKSLWSLWRFLQRNSPYRIRKNPPSSGFLGIATLIRYCRVVRTFEYVPSSRISQRCHYYDEPDVNGRACTMGVWHPLAAEKMAAQHMAGNTDFEIYQRGFIEIAGFI